MRESQVRFILQQGFREADASDALYAALMFQPRVIGSLVAVGVVLHSAWLFLALSAVLVWSTVVAKRNPFDALYNRFVARPRGLTLLGVAPAPRRFAQTMAGGFAFAIGAALTLGASNTARVLEALMAMAIASVVFRDFCGPACLYHLVRRPMTKQRSLMTSAGTGC